ncbi:MAG: hypothetical protein HC784_14085 [Hydrococcus sp. CSU_1_8]|nr:hypothetical protein [Hydrococcus sp. CSU_1_8]
MHYKDIHEPTKWGSWGLIEHVDDTSSPRYDAVMADYSILLKCNSA